MKRKYFQKIIRYLELMCFQISVLYLCQRVPQLFHFLLPACGNLPQLKTDWQLYGAHQTWMLMWWWITIWFRNSYASLVPYFKNTLDTFTVLISTFKRNEHSTETDRFLIAQQKRNGQKENQSSVLGSVDKIESTDSCNRFTVLCNGFVNTDCHRKL